MEMGPELFHSVIGNECLPPTTLACTESNEGTILNVLETAFGYISLDCSQIQLLVIQIQNDNLQHLTEASFGFLADS